MKTILTLLVFSLLVFSCKKKKQPVSTKYTCTCKVSSNFGYLYTTEPSYSNISWSEAETKCKEEKYHQENLVIYEGYKRTADCTLH